MKLCLVHNEPCIMGNVRIIHIRLLVLRKDGSWIECGDATIHYEVWTEFLGTHRDVLGSAILVLPEPGPPAKIGVGGTR